jgi:hypothetical protein
MAKLITLRKCHTKCISIRSPVLDGANPVPPEEIERLMSIYIKDRSTANRDAVVMAFRSIIRHVVGRYIANWPSISSMKDDLVSIGFETLLLGLPTIESEVDVCGIMTNRMVSRMSVYINKFKTAASPSKKKQQHDYKDGREPVIAVDIDSVDTSNYTVDSEESHIDFIEALDDLEVKDKIDEALLDPENWNKTDTDFAAEYGISRPAVWARKQRLLKCFERLLYDDVD